ncbi:MAG: lysophospholipid acyltransferase family protein [Phycisphaerales bacterium]|nr:lysophospholipid acyltransferase family protein [Phycisphaerales bacterium]
MAKRKFKPPSWIHAPLYLAVRAFLATMQVGDLSSNLRTARAVARRYAAFEKRRVQRTMDTIGVAFPGMPEAERHEHAMQAYEHLFMLGVEMAYTPRLITPDSWPQYLRLIGLEPAARLMLTGRPCVMITGHCGNWELLGYAMAVLGFRMHALYRPLDMKPLDQWLRRTRQRRGLELLDKFGAVKAMPELMSRGELVAFIADQNAGDRGLFVPFFNRLASTYKSIGIMAMQFDAPIVCGQARRLVRSRDAEDGSMSIPPQSAGFAEYDGTHPLRYEIVVHDIIMPEDWKSEPDPLFYVSARYRRAIEQMVRLAPEQNLWLHRYWKSRPRHEHLGRPIPAALKAKIRALPWTTDDDMARLEDWSARDAAELASKAPKPANVPLELTASTETSA